MILHLDLGHKGKPPPHDRNRGAVRADGVTEAELAQLYIAAATKRAVMRGAQVHYPMTPAYYGARQVEACRVARLSPLVQHRYVACHLNAGGGRYGLVGYDLRSGLGRELAVELAGALADACHWLGGVRAHGVAHDSAMTWERNVFATIGRVYDGPANIAAVCFEPGFIDHDGATTPEALALYGVVLADVLTGHRQAVGGDVPPERSEE